MHAAQSEDDRVWDKGTPFESGPEHDKPTVPTVPYKVWDKGTPFESYEELK